MRPNKYEKFVNAEIPDPTNPILHENVVKHYDAWTLWSTKEK